MTYHIFLYFLERYLSTLLPFQMFLLFNNRIYFIFIFLYYKYSIILYSTTNILPMW